MKLTLPLGGSDASSVRGGQWAIKDQPGTQEQRALPARSSRPSQWEGEIQNGFSPDMDDHIAEQ